MKKVVGIISAFTVFTVIYGGMNYYVFRGLLAGLEINGLQLLAVRLLFILLGTAYIAAQALKTKFNVKILNYLGAMWMGVLGISITVFLLSDIVLWYFNIEGNLHFVAVTLIVLLILYSIIKVKKGPKIKNVSINNGQLSEQLSIIHLADIHLGIMTSEIWLDDLVKKVNALNGDLVVITGDMVDDSFDVVKKFAPKMASIKAKYGIYAVAGNHEHYQGIENYYEFCKAANINVLDNNAVSIGSKYNLIGIDDSLTKGDVLYKRVGELINKGEGVYNILLLHQPVGFKKSSAMGIDLQLSGHTHKGQLPPLNLFVPIKYPHYYGLYTIGKSHIYTTSGTGTWGPPMRLFTNSEIVKINVS